MQTTQADGALLVELAPSSVEADGREDEPSVVVQLHIDEVSEEKLDADFAFKPAAIAAIAAPTPAATAPLPSWRDELRAAWDSEQQRLMGRREARRIIQSLPPLTSFERSCPPLRGDIVWNASSTLRRIRLFERRTFVHSSTISHARFHRLTRQIVSLIQPITALALLICIYSLTVVTHKANPHLAERILLYKERAADSTLRKFKGSLLNALTVLGGISAITAIFIAFFMRQWRRVSGTGKHERIGGWMQSGWILCSTASGAHKLLCCACFCVCRRSGGS